MMLLLVICGAIAAFYAAVGVHVLVSAMDRLQAQVEHLHRAMLQEFKDSRTSGLEDDDAP